MKIGRLKSATLNSILRSVGIATEENPELISAIPSACKYYIPTSANNPLYGTFSVNPHLAVASAAMAASNPNHSPEIIDTPAVGSAPSPTLVLSPETTLAIQAASAHQSPTLQTRSTRWSSFVDDRTPLDSISDVNEHRRTQSWPRREGERRESDVNINTIQTSRAEDDSFNQRAELSLRVNSQMSTNDITSASPSLDNISIPLLPEIPEMDQLQLKENDSKKSWISEFEHIDIDWSMKTMDTIYSASFYSYIRDEKNLDLASIRLSRIIKDYKPRQVALALRWLTQGWSVENTSRLLRNVFMDWLPDLAACVFTLMSKDWPPRPQLSLCCAYLLINEPPAVAGTLNNY
jgi:hypothetical protein